MALPELRTVDRLNGGGVSFRRQCQLAGAGTRAESKALWRTRDEGVNGGGHYREPHAVSIGSAERQRAVMTDEPSKVFHGEVVSACHFAPLQLPMVFHASSSPLLNAGAEERVVTHLPGFEGHLPFSIRTGYPMLTSSSLLHFLC